MCTQLASMGVACSDETGGVVEYVGSNLGSCGGLFYDDMLECTTINGNLGLYYDQESELYCDTE